MKKNIKNFISKIPVWLRVKINQFFSFNDIDGHFIIYIFGVHIRIKHKNHKNIINEVSSWGLNKTPRTPMIIASLTTFPERIYAVKETIKTLLKQTFKPDKLLLWLAEEQFPKRESELPEELLELKNYGLTIKWYKDIKSYKKLIPALKEYPNDIIITFDDDIYYENNIIEMLYNAHLQNPSCIITNRYSHLVLDNNNIRILPAAYAYWAKPKDSSYRNAIIGCGGVLYPPHSLHSEVLNENAFKTIIPTQDDIWFWAMAVLNNTKIKVAGAYDINLVTVNNTQQYGLCKINKANKRGMPPLKGYNIITEYYPKIKEKIKGEDK